MVKIIIKDELEKDIDELQNDGASKVNVTETIEKLQNFLREFNIDLSIRLFNTLVHTAEPSNHLINYAMLTGRDYLDLANKTKSKEYKIIEKQIKEIETDKKVNNRFKLYFGSAGTGKTTRALEETNNKVIVMHDNITPKELVFDFTFVDGQPKFVKNAFAQAMENGEKIVLDEINLAPYETIRFLQGVLDNKTEVYVGDELIKIKDGFEVIGTMNEEILGMESYLPEPLVDRAKEVKKFTLTPEMIADFAV